MPVSPWRTLVDLDDYKAANEGDCADEMESEVSKSAGAFLFGGMRRLEDEGGLCCENQSGRV